MRLPRQLQANFFFSEKTLSLKEYQRAKQTIFTLLEVFAKICCLCCLVFAYFCFVSWFLLMTCVCRLKFFSYKEINRLEIVLITSFTILLSVHCRTQLYSLNEVFESILSKNNVCISCKDTLNLSQKKLL